MPMIQVETEAVILLLVVATGVAIFTKRIGLPYIVSIVIVGVVARTTNRFQPEAIVLSRDLLMCVFLPPILFESAMRFRLRELRENAAAIGAFASLGFLAAAGISGGLAYLLIACTGVADLGSGTAALLVCLLFGALISATDPVSVIALFKRLRVPRRLKAIVEGESLGNDGVAVVVFGLLLAALTDPKADTTVLHGIAAFVKMSAGGIAGGLLLGLAVDRISRAVEDTAVEITLTLVLAYGAYFVAESFHLSGVMAVIGAGLMTGNTIDPVRLSPYSQFSLNAFWDYAVFVSNSLVFLLVGLRIDLRELLGHWPAVALAVLIVTAARAAVIYPIASLVGRVGRSIPTPWRHVMLWGGLRGAIAMVLALSLAEFTNDRLTPEATGALRSMTLGVVLFTIVVQGLTMPPLLRRLGLVGRSEPDEARELEALRQTRKIVGDLLQKLHGEGKIHGETFEALWAEYALQSAEHRRQEAMDAQALLQEEARMRRLLRDIGQAVFSDLQAKGTVSEETIARELKAVESPGQDRKERRAT